MLGGIAVGGTGADIILIARAVFKLNLRLVVGYPGSPEINIAIQRGEIDGRAIGMSSIQATMGDWWNAGKLRFLVQFGRETRWRGCRTCRPRRSCTTAPRTRRWSTSPKCRSGSRGRSSRRRACRGDQAAILKRAFMECQKDPAFLKEAKDMKIDISPLGGDEVHDIVARIAHTPPAVVQHYKDILASK